VVDVADELDRGREAGVGLGRDGVDDDDRLVGTGVPVLGSVLDEVVADGDHEVGVAEAGELVVAVVQTDRAERPRVLVVQRALAHERLGDRDAGRARERAQRGGRPRAQDAVAGQHDRAGRVAHEPGGPQQLARARLGVRLAAAGERSGVERRRHDVLGELEVRRAGLGRLGDLERLADDLGDDLGARDARVPLRDRAQHLDEVDELMGLLVHPFQRPLSGERDERRAVQIRVGDGGDEVQRAGTERPEAHPGPPGEPAADVGHVGARLLVAHRDEVDRGPVQRVVEVERFLAGDSEHPPDALVLQALDEHVRGATGGHPGHLVFRATCLSVPRITRGFVPASPPGATPSARACPEGR
jgi:hypothetical protein